MRKLLLLALIISGLIQVRSLGAEGLTTGLFTVNEENIPGKYISIRQAGTDLEVIFLRTTLDTPDKEGNPVYAPAQYRAVVPQKISNASTASYPLTMLLQKVLPGDKADKQLKATIKPLSENEFEFQLGNKTFKAQRRSIREITFAYMPEVSPSGAFFYESEEPGTSWATGKETANNREFFLIEKGDSPILYFAERDGTLEKFEASDFSFGLYPVDPNLPATNYHILFTLLSEKKKLWRFEIDMVRSPASDVSGILTGANRKRARFTQANLITYKSCKDGKCEILLSDNQTYFLRQDKSIITMRMQPDEKTIASYGKKHMYTITVDETRITLKDKSGEKVFVPDAPATPDK